MTTFSRFTVSTFTMILLATGLLATSLLSLGCAGQSGGSNAAGAIPAPPSTSSRKVELIGGSDFMSLDAGTELKEESGMLQGTGGIVANLPLAKTESANHFAFTAELDPGGSLKILTNAMMKDGAFSQGYEIEFQRSTDAAVTALQVTARASGREADVSARFAQLNASRGFQIQVDIHNDHAGDSHVVAWTGPFTTTPPVWNSETHVGTSPGRGYGDRWGFVLTRARIHWAKLDVPKFHHGENGHDDHDHDHSH